MDQENKHPQKIDITIRDIIPSFSESAFIKMITGTNYKRVLNSAFPSTKERRVDLLLELEDNSILHIEFQTSNDKDMLYRMLEYCSLIKSHFKDRSLYQKLIYLGEDKCNMENSFEDIGISYKYERLIFRHHPRRLEASCDAGLKRSGRLDGAVPQGRGQIRSRSPRTDSQEKPRSYKADAPKSTTAG
jgi:hypothetical protein